LLFVPHTHGVTAPCICRGWKDYPMDMPYSEREDSKIL